MNVDLRKNSQTWPIRTKVARGIWSYFGAIVFSLLPKSPTFIKSAWLRLFGAKVGKAVLFCKGIKILQPWCLEVGDYVAIGERVNIYNYATVKVGSMVVISEGVFLCTGTHDWRKEDYPLVWKNITIENQSWVAVDCFIAPGVVVGEGAVIGARTVLRKNADPWTVYLGNPAHPVKSRVIGEMPQRNYSSRQET